MPKPKPILHINANTEEHKNKANRVCGKLTTQKYFICTWKVDILYLKTYCKILKYNNIKFTSIKPEITNHGRTTIYKICTPKSEIRKYLERNPHTLLKDKKGIWHIYLENVRNIWNTTLIQEIQKW